MKLFFEPGKVALIGASTNKRRPGNQLFRNMEVGRGVRVLAALAMRK